MTVPATTPYLLLSQIQQEITSASSSTSSAYYRRLIVQASKRLETWCNRRFDEYIATRYYDATVRRLGGAIDGLDLWLDTDLRTITTLTNGDGSTIASNQYTLQPRNESYKRWIHLLNNSGAAWGIGATDPIGAISVLGTWGYGGQWLNTGATVVSMTDSATTFTSSSGTLLEEGMVLKIDSEYLYCDGVSGNTITVSRAYNGSTAASHTTATIYNWQPDPQVTAAVGYLVMWHIKRMQSGLTNEVFIGDQGIPVTINQVPKEAQDMVAGLRWRVVGAWAV